MAVISIQIGAGSGVYARAFTDPQRFGNLLREAEQKAGMKFAPRDAGRLERRLRRDPGDPEIAGGVRAGGSRAGHRRHPYGLCRRASPARSNRSSVTENLEGWVRLARDAIAGKKRLIVTHSEIFPGTFASTTETADYLLAQLGLQAARGGALGADADAGAERGAGRRVSC